MTILTSTSVSSVQEIDTGTSYELYFIVGGSISYDIDHPLNGMPLTFRIYDETTGQTLGTFTEQSNAPACTIVVASSADRSTETLTGDAIAPYSGCPFQPISAPGADVIEMSATFPGSGKYARSTSLPVALA